MKVATWNVNSIGVRQERVLAFLARHQPDLLALQELKCTDENFPWDAIRAAGYQAVVRGQKTYNGVAIVYRNTYDCRVLDRHIADHADDPAARMVAARIGGVNFICVYVPNGQEVGSEKYYYKLNWLSRFTRYLQQWFRPGEPLIVAGDFNIAPTSRDVHDPDAWHEKVLCSTREREALRTLMAFGLADIYRKVHPASQGFTWWDYRSGAFARDHGLRIDLMLATPPVLEKVRECEVDRQERDGEKPSDHAPVIAVF